jgi:hypothetical protein
MSLVLTFDWTSFGGIQIFHCMTLCFVLVRYCGYNSGNIFINNKYYLWARGVLRSYGATRTTFVRDSL